MATQRYLPHAPIKEAVVDLRVELPAGTTHEPLASAAKGLLEEYPQQEVMLYFESGLRIEAGRAIHHAEGRKVIGYRVASTNGKRIAQFRVDGFVCSALEPYSGWDSTFAEAMKLWRIYLRAVAPSRVTRLAVRYINHLVFQLPVRDFDEYLLAPPATPEDLDLNSFLSRVIVVNPASPGMFAAITQASMEPVTPGHFGMILDIDAFKEGNYHPEDAEINTTFQQLREFKNRLFFASVTEKTVELYT